MTLTVETSSIRKVDLKTLVSLGPNALSAIVQDYGVVYVTSITRDGCSGCEEQKPLFKDLAVRLHGQNQGRMLFNNVHVVYQNADVSQSEQAKRVLGHGSYPTYMINVKSHYGILEHYRAAYPKMEELEREALNALELAEYYKGLALTRRI